MKVNVREGFLEEYYANFEKYKERDDANVYSSILNDMKRGQPSEIDFLFFIVVELAKEYNVNLPTYFMIADKFKEYNNIQAKKYCKHITNTLSFHQKNVRYCTTLQMGPIISEYKESAEELADLVINSKKKSIYGKYNCSYIYYISFLKENERRIHC